MKDKIQKVLKGLTPDYVNEVAKLKYKMNFHRFTTIVLLLAVLILVYANITVTRAQKVIIIPSYLSEKVEVGDSIASATYLKAMGNYIAMLLYNFNSNTVEAQYEELSKFMVASVRKDAIKQAQEYTKTNTSSRIVVQSINATDKKITVRMRRTKYLLDKPVDEKPINLGITYKIEYGTMKVSKLEIEE